LKIYTKYDIIITIIDLREEVIYMRKKNFWEKLDRFISAVLFVFMVVATIGMYSQKTLFEPIMVVLTIMIFYTTIRLFEKSK